MCSSGNPCDVPTCPALRWGELLAVSIWDWSSTRLCELEPYVRSASTWAPRLKPSFSTKTSFPKLCEGLDDAHSRLALILSNLSPEHRVTAFRKKFLDVDMFESLVEEFDVPSHNCVFGMAHTLHLAGFDDLTGDEIINGVWAKIWETRLPGYENDNPFEYYYAAMLRNAVYQWVRTRNRRRWYQSLDDFKVDPPTQEVDTEIAEIREAVEKLPDERQRQILQMALQGWTVKQIAAELGLPLGTVYSLRAKARVKLGPLLLER